MIISLIDNALREVNVCYPETLVATSFYCTRLTLYSFGDTPITLVNMREK